MKITKVDRTRSAVGKRETAPGAGRGILYRSPGDGKPLSSVESQVEARVNAANRMYSAFFKGRKTDPATRNLQRYFTEIVKYLAKEDSIRATYAGGEEQAIRAAIEGQIGKLKCMKWIFVYNAKERKSDRLEIAKLPRMYNSEDAFRDAMRESFLCMRRSLKRGTNRRVAEKLMRGLAQCGPLTFEQAVNELDRDSHEELVHFLDCVNRDYHRTNVAKSIQNNDVKVQAGQEQLLELTCATDEKNKGLRKTLEDYASSQEQGDAALLTIKKILFSYFLSGDEKAAEEFLQAGKLWNIPRQEELFFDESFEGEGGERYNKVTWKKVSKIKCFRSFSQHRNEALFP
jgi:hypothetical protein